MYLNLTLRQRKLCQLRIVAGAAVMPLSYINKNNVENSLDLGHISNLWLQFVSSHHRLIALELLLQRLWVQTEKSAQHNMDTTLHCG
jgi:hypothetical protein